MIIHTNDYAEKKYKGTNWDVVQARGAKNIEKAINDYAADGTVLTNLVIAAHGATNGIVLGNGDQFEKGDLLNGNEDSKTFQRILSKIQANGNLVFITCNCAVGLAGSMKATVNRTDVNIFQRYCKRDRAQGHKPCYWQNKIPRIH